MKYRPLLLRSNRALGAALLNKSWVSVENLEAANTVLLEEMQKEQYSEANLLKILANKMKVLDEAGLLHTLANEEHLPFADLRIYETTVLAGFATDLELCRFTWTLPFNQRDNIWYVATASYLSEPVRQKWEEVLHAPILWYLTSLQNVEEALNALRIRK